MKLSIYLPAAVLALVAAPLATADPLKLEEETPRINYSLGYQIGGDFKRQGVEMDAEAVVQGIRDALSGAEPQMTPAEMTRVTFHYIAALKLMATALLFGALFLTLWVRGLRRMEAS